MIASIGVARFKGRINNILRKADAAAGKIKEQCATIVDTQRSIRANYPVAPKKNHLKLVGKEG